VKRPPFPSQLFHDVAPLLPPFTTVLSLPVIQALIYLKIHFSTMQDNIVAPPSSFAVVDLVIPLLFRVGTVVVGLGAIVAGLLYAKQDNLLYFPSIGGIPKKPSQNPRRYRSPAEHGIPFESHMIECQDGIKIHSWLLLHPDSQRERNPTLIFFHGNAGNIGLRLPNAIEMYRQLNVNVLLVEYRGYGDSDDVAPTEAGLKLDSEAALRFISTHPLIDSSRLFVFGRSLGGAVGFHLANYAQLNSLPLAGIIVENTFLSISEMVDHLMPYVKLFKPLVLRLNWDSSVLVPNIRAPTLYLAGSADELVPHNHMMQLYKASNKSSVLSRMHVVPGGTHNETWLQGGRAYFDRMRSFIAEAMAIQENGVGSSVRSLNSMEDVPISDVPIKGGTSVGMGTDTETKTSSIPLMPMRLVDMAHSVVGSSTDSKKKEM
jgi:hypothetical protein